MTRRLGNDGYAFANVNSAPELDRQKQEVAFTIVVDPGRRVYVRRINIGGNTKTRDEVIRREIRQLESGWYDGARITKSKERIDIGIQYQSGSDDSPNQTPSHKGKRSYAS